MNTIKYANIVVCVSHLPEREYDKLSYISKNWIPLKTIHNYVAIFNVIILFFLYSKNINLSYFGSIQKS